MKKKILSVIIMFIFIIGFAGCNNGYKRPYTNRYSNYSDFESDINEFTKRSGQEKPFMLFKDIATECFLHGWCGYNDVKYVEEEDMGRASYLYDMRAYMKLNYNTKTPNIYLYSSFEIEDVNKIYFEFDTSKIQFKSYEAKLESFVYEGRPIVSGCVSSDELDDFLVYLKQELINCGYVKN